LFSGAAPNAFVYYTDFAKAAAAKYKKAGKTVYINFVRFCIPQPKDPPNP
jgi:hypothetical protein